MKKNLLGILISFITAIPLIFIALYLFLFTFSGVGQPVNPLITVLLTIIPILIGSIICWRITKNWIAVIILVFLLLLVNSSFFGVF